jgi:hypothetical protein
MKPREEEQETIRLMIAIYCSAAHGYPRRGPFCAECARLADYAAARLGRCPWGEEKPTCARCPTHCYKPGMREAVRKVMRFSGPRMLLSHPARGIRHVLKGLRSAPKKRRQNPPSTSAQNPPSTSAHRRGDP